MFLSVSKADRRTSHDFLEILSPVSKRTDTNTSSDGRNESVGFTGPGRKQGTRKNRYLSFNSCDIIVFQLINITNCFMLRIEC